MKPNFKWAYLSKHWELSELFDGPGRSEHASLLNTTHMMTSHIFRILQASINRSIPKSSVSLAADSAKRPAHDLRDGPTGMLAFHSIHLSIKLWQCTSELPIADSQRPWSRRRPRNRPSAGPAPAPGLSSCRGLTPTGLRTEPCYVRGTLGLEIWLAVVKYPNAVHFNKF